MGDYNTNTNKSCSDSHTQSQCSEWAKQRIIDIHPLSTLKINYDFWSYSYTASNRASVNMNSQIF